MPRWMAMGLAGCLLLAGCSGRKSSLLLERHAVGPLEEAPAVGREVAWQLDPMTQSQELEQVAVTVSFAPAKYLDELFKNRKIFGEFAGRNPYFAENLVFYITVENHRQERILIDPRLFVLVDDRGNQYSPIGLDYITALADARQPVSTVTRGVLEDARPGYFGFSLPLGKLFAQKPQGRFALIKQSSLQTGYMYPGVIHDGLVAFWSPVEDASTLRLLVTSVKTGFDPKDLPTKTLEFPFTFQVRNQ